MFAIVFPRILLESLLDLIYFPLWWYTAGILRALKWCGNLLQDGNNRLAPGLWLHHIFVPMYGQYDWQGRIVSFFMRAVQVILRGLGLGIWALFCLMLFCVWLVIPLIIVRGLVKYF